MKSYYIATEGIERTNPSLSHSTESIVKHAYIQQDTESIHKWILQSSCCVQTFTAVGVHSPVVIIARAVLRTLTYAHE